MKHVAELSVTQARLYPADALPFAHLCFPKNAQAIREAFKFEQAQFDGSTLTFQNGSFDHQGRSILISSLTIEERRLVLKVLDKSSAADAVYKALVPVLDSLDTAGMTCNYDPILKSEETTCVATLDIDFNKLISPEMGRFLGTYVMNALRTDFGIPKSIGLRRFSFEVRYEPTNPSLREHSISVADKVLRLEPRIGTPWQESRFFAVSPTDSATHLALLEALENELSGSEKKKGT